MAAVQVRGRAPFAMIPDHVIGDTRIDAGAFRLLAALVMHGDNPDNCFPSLKLLAGLVGCSTSTVKRQVSTLIEAGYVTKVERRRENGSQTSNGFNVDLTPRSLVHPPPGHPCTPPQVTSEPPPRSLVNPPERDSSELDPSEQDQANEVASLFALWQTVHGHPRSVLDKTRRRVITAALKSHCFERTADAIRGMAFNPWSQGSGGTVYNDLTHALGKAERIERHAGRWEHHIDQCGPIPTSAGEWAEIRAAAAAGNGRGGPPKLRLVERRFTEDGEEF